MEWLLWIFGFLGMVTVLSLGIINYPRMAGTFLESWTTVDGGDKKSATVKVNYSHYSTFPIVLATTLIVFFVFTLSFPLWTASYVEAGGPDWWVLLLAVVAIVAAAGFTEGKMRSFLLAITVGLLTLVVSVYLASGLINMPACLADDIACRERVAAVEAAELAKEVALAERRAVIAKAEERARATSNYCPGIAETFDLVAGQEEVINNFNCQLRWKIRFGCVQALNEDADVIYKKACAGGDEANVPSGLHTVIAVGGPVKLKRIECEPGTSGANLDSCT